MTVSLEENICTAAKRVGVTGGAGMIGSSLVEQLVTVGANVVVIDDMSRGRESNLTGVAGQIELRVGDLEDGGFAAQAISDCDIVFHLASRAYGVAYSEGRHLEILHHNEVITQNLLTTLAARPPQRLLVASSSCVYPDDGPDTIPELPLFTGDPEFVNRGYGWAKRFLEQKSALFSAETGVPVVAVRPFNIVSERYNWAGEHSQAIPMLVKRIMDGEDPIIIWGSGNQRRSYIHAEDCAHMMLDLMSSCNHSVTVNLGTEETVSIMELARMICETGGVSSELQNDPTKLEGRFTKSADTKLLRSLLPEFELSISLEEFLPRMIEWYRSTDFSAPLSSKGAKLVYPSLAQQKYAALETP